MNKDQVKGTTDKAVGKVKEVAGRVTGDSETEAKGLAQQAKGNVQKKVGDAKEVVKDAVDKL
jgi:uncharacterized protein YjbJ (UPF0337 family)